MKKFMALCLAMLMALSMVSFSVMAEETAATFAEIANGQPAQFVTSDLSLGANTITSSNEAVIATDGTVTRPIFEDATVTLTINGGEAIDVVVKAKTADVKVAEDYSADEYPDWTFNVPEGNEAPVIANGVFNMIIGPTDGGRTSLTKTLPEASGDKIVVIRFDLVKITEVTSSGIDIRISGDRYDAEGTRVGYYSTATVARMYPGNAGFGNNWMGASRKADVEIKYNPQTGEFWGNGVKCAKNLFDSTDSGFYMNESHTADEVASAITTSITFTNAGGGCTGDFEIDNFVVYEEVSAEDALASATPAEMLANYSKYLDEAYVTNGGSFDAVATNLKFTADEELPADVTLEWTSDSDAIATDGTVSRAVFESKTATITGTLTVGEESITKTYDVTLLPLTIAGESETVDFDSYDLEDGAGIEKDGWTVSSSEASITNVVDNGNSYAQVSSTLSGGTSNVITYSFSNVPALGDARYYIMAFDYKVATPIANVINVGLKINGTAIAEFVNRSSQLHGQDWATGQPWYGGSTTGSITPPTEFVNLQIVVDTAANTVSYVVGDRPISTTTCPEVDFTNIESANLYVDWRAASGAFDIDNIKIYAENTLEGAIATLDDAGKVAFFKDLIEASSIGSVSGIGDALQLDNGYADYDLQTVGVNIDWTSSAPEYILNDGEVVKNASFLTKSDVTMTATITAGAVSDTVTFAMSAPDGTQLLSSSDFSDTTVSSGKATYVDDEDPAHGKVLHLETTEIGKHTSSDNVGIISYGDWKGRAVVSADVKYVNGSEASCGGIVIKTIAGYNGISVLLNFETNKVSVLTTLPEAEADASKLKANSAKTVYLQMDSELAEKEGEWVNITVDFNALSQTFVLYIDGTLYTELPMLQANMKTAKNGGGSVRGISLECSNKGELWADNISIRKFTNDTETEVNAALNAAIIDFGSEYVKPVLTNCNLPSMTIGRSWHVAADAFNRDVEEDGSIKPSNVSTYTYVTDGPEISWKINGIDATEVNVDYPQVVEITVTATKDGITESKTFRRKVAPAAILGLAASTEALNGVWMDSVNAETDKVVIAQYNGKKLVSTKIISLKDNENYSAETGILKLTGFVVPAKNADVDALKVFVIGDKGISPITFKNDELRG